MKIKNKNLDINSRMRLANGSFLLLLPPRWGHRRRRPATCDTAAQNMQRRGAKHSSFGIRIFENYTIGFLIDNICHDPQSNIFENKIMTILMFVKYRIITVRTYYLLKSYDLSFNLHLFN